MMHTWVCVKHPHGIYRVSSNLENRDNLEKSGNFNYGQGCFQIEVYFLKTMKNN